MPFGDGTGPAGMGPGTGRGRGWDRRDGINLGRMMFQGRSGWMWALAAPAIIAAVRDLSNPKGLLRRYTSALLGKKRTEDQRHIRQNVEYTIGDIRTNTMSRDTGSKGKGKTS